MSARRAKELFPARPALTPAFVCAIGFWVACALAFSTGTARDDLASGVAVASCAAVFVLSACTVLAGKVGLAGIALASVAAGALLGVSQGAFMHVNAASLDGLANAPAQIKLLEDSVDYGYGENALVEARFEGFEPMTFSARLGDCGPLLNGQRFEGVASFSPHDYSTDGRAWQEGSCGKLTVKLGDSVSAGFPVDALIDLRRRAIERIGDGTDEQALLQALVCGYRRTMRNTELYGQFQTCGLAHLVAVSGAHLVIVTGLFGSALRHLRVPRRLSVGLLMAAMVSYYVIAGMPVSALRATIMSSLGLLSYFGKRRPSSLNAVGIGLFAIVTASPVSSVSASLVLSVLSTTGIVLFGPLVQSWLRKTPLVRVPIAVDALSLTFASSVLSQLYACSLFSQLPVIAPLANLVCAPLFPLVCGTGLASGLVRATLLSAAGTVGFVPLSLSALLAKAVAVMAAIPNACVPFAIETPHALAVSGIAALALWVAWPKPRASSALAMAALVALCAFGATFSADRADKLVMFDVGQGDSLYVQSRGRNLLIDTGNQDAKLLRELAANGVHHLDAVLITHSDDDHCGSLDQVGKTVPTDRVLLASDMLDCAGSSAVKLVNLAGSVSDQVVGLKVGDVFSIGAFRARVAWPHGFVDEGGNADSLCVMLEYDGDDDGTVDFRALMTGDAEKDELASMLGENTVGDIDVLKVGHHGSRNGMTSDEAAALNPELALISCGAGNRYGHPTQEVLDMLGQMRAEVFRTDQDGEVSCYFTPSTISVRCGNR